MMAFDTETRSVLSQCAVFRGPFGLRAAVAVLQAARPLEVVRELAQQGWLQIEGDARGGTRYRMPETVRAQLLRQGTPPDTAERHARFHAFEQEGRPEMLGDFIAALRWGLDRGERSVAIGAALGASRLLEARGPAALAMGLLEQALGVAPDHPELLQRSAAALLGAGRLDEANARAELAIARAVRARQPQIELRAHRVLCSSLRRTGPLERAEQAHERALSRAWAVGDGRLQADILCDRVRWLQRLGRVQEAGETAERALLLARRIGDPGTECRSLCALASAVHRMGRREERCAYLEQALALTLARGDLGREADIRTALGLTLFELGRLDAAADQLERCLQPGTRLPRALLHLSRVRFAQGRPEEGQQLLSLAADEARERGDSQTLAETRDDTTRPCLVISSSPAAAAPFGAASGTSRPTQSTP